jgi:hypothetical protein
MKLPKNISREALLQALGEQKYEEIMLLVYGPDALKVPIGSAKVISRARDQMLAEEPPDQNEAGSLGRMSWHFSRGDTRRQKVFVAYLNEQLRIAEEAEAEGAGIHTVARPRQSKRTPGDLEMMRAQAARMREAKQLKKAERQEAVG